MRKIKLFLTALAVMVASTAFAQKLTVTGNVTDASNGEPVPFASVHEKGTMNGVNTDVDGQYSITVSKDAVLVFSSIGYNSVEIAVEGKAQINCDLPVDAETLDNAVVVGYGSAKKVGTIVGSVTTVNSDAIKTAPSSSALDQLQGQVAGLSVMTTGGVAGENNVSMQLHGQGSLGASSTPLYIIDGMQASSRAIQAMNPNDILSITILKDASATSIYGSRAANGVVVVTTRAGAYNAEKASVSFRSQAGISTLADMTLYKNMLSGPELKEFWTRSGLMTPEQIRVTYTDKGFDADTKWYNYYQQFNNPQFQNDVIVEGGGQKVAYMIGASQFHQRGTAIGNVYDRYTVRTNVQGRPKEWLKVAGNVAVSYDKRSTNPNWGGASGGAGYTAGGLSYLNNPLYPAVDENGDVFEQQFPDGMYTPSYYVANLPNMSHRYGLLTAFNVEIEPIPNLKIASRAGLDGYISMADSKRVPSFLATEGNGTRSRSAGFEYTATITNTIEYAFNIGHEHQIVVLAGQEGVAEYYDAFSAGTEGITDDRLTNLQNGKNEKNSVSESFVEGKFLSFFGRVDYALMDKYYFDASVRNDACSRFGPNNKNATFWAAGAMWKMKRESFLQNAYWLTDLNAKVSYGTQGNASIGDYQYLALVGAMSDYAAGSSLGLAQPSNYDLTWEKQSLFTAGINGRIADMVDFNIEYYRRKTSSMLMDVPYNYTTGISSLYANVGGLLNQGVDITLGVDILRGKDHFLRFNKTFNWNAEKVTELFNGLDRWEMVGYGFAYVVGEPVSFYYPIYAGVNPENGKQQWYVPGENVDKTTMDPSQVTENFDEAGLTQNTGKRLNPPVNGGFSFSGGWRGFSFQADFSYVLGKYLINNDAFFYANPYQNLDCTQHKDVQDFWTPDNTDAKYPSWKDGEIMQFDTHLLEKADFLRLKNLQVAYDFPRHLLGTQKVLNGLKLSFTARNLFCLTNYSGVDPEVAGNLTYGRVGNSKQYLFGLELTF
ncbi:MAG: SusC/RagA family TonB-linked outer membrane protein [Bacteroidales bacterium]|nr:SusC/RagA family TonB-linked outer membrane protein [Bacteroidales bacterium]